MINNKFNLHKTLINNSYFLNKIEVWKHESLDIILTIVNFDLNKYRLDLYSEIGISIPNTILCSVPKRQAEYLAGRVAALNCFKYSEVEIDEYYTLESSEHRYPEWPESIIGSISHSNVMAACVIAKRSEYRGIGIDIENLKSASKINRDIAELILTKEETLALENSKLNYEFLKILAFSAKESLFKSIHPIHHDFLDFHDASITSICSNSRSIDFKIDKRFNTKYPNRIKCNFSFNSNHVLTSTAIKNF